MIYRLWSMTNDYFLTYHRRRLAAGEGVALVDQCRLALGELGEKKAIALFCASYDAIAGSVFTNGQPHDGFDH